MCGSEPLPSQDNGESLSIMKTLITTLLTMALSFTAYAQQVTASAGAEHKNANGSVTFTLGELVIAALQGGGTQLTQGFHQNNIQVTVTAVFDPIFSSVKVFPNPTAERVFIHLGNSSLNGSTYRLHDLNGRQLSAGNIRGKQATIEVASYVPGIYVLTILKDEKTMITYQIIKQ